MKIWKFVAALVAVAILAFGTLGAGVVFAKSVLPAWGPFLFGMGMGPGHMNGSSMMNGYSGMMNGGGMMGSRNHMHGIDMDTMHDWMMGPGGLHQQVLKDLAANLGLSVDQLNSELQNGKSLAQLAQEKGISPQLASILESSVLSALDKAVAGKVLTQEQADAMLQRMSGSYEQMLSFMGLGMGQGAGGCLGSSD